MIDSIYVAYPIDQRDPSASTVYVYEQVEVFKKQAAAHVSWIFDPGDAFLVNPSVGVDQGLALINRHALNVADALVAFLPAGVPTIGVPMEINLARAQGKPVLVMSDTDSYMLNLPGIYRLGGWNDGDLAEAVRWVVEVEPYREPQYWGTVAVKADAPEFLPTRHYADDAGLDLVTSEPTVIRHGSFADVPCGVSVELPDRHWAMITGRSSTLRKRGLLVHPGIIDTGYRGPLFAGVWNQTDKDVIVQKGDRIAQLIMFGNSTMRYAVSAVEKLTPSERGENGFGSTGA